jgi:hypothetical protein
MKTLLKILFLFIFWITLFNIGARAAEERVVIDSLSTDSTMLKVDFHAENLINDEIIERLNSGFTTIFEYRLQLWKKRTFIFSQVITEKAYRIKLAFDNWDRRYRIQTLDEDRRTSSIKKAREICLEIQDFELLPISQLKINSDYFLTIRLLIKPISVENLAEIERALKGENASKEEIEHSKYSEENPEVKNRFLKFLLAFTGLGDKVLNSQNVSFRLNQKHQIIWNE